jgi:predicted dehydrogenase
MIRTRRCKSLIVGVGTRGLLHLRALSEYADGMLRPIAAYDIQEARRVRAREIPGVTVLEAPDAVRDYMVDEIAIIATPPSSHVQYAMSLIDLAPRLLIEKPAANSSPEFDILHSAADRANASVFVGYSERYNLAVRSTRARIAELVRNRIVTHLRFIRKRPATKGAAKDARQELAVHDVDFVVNELFPSERLRFEQRRSKGAVSLRSFSSATGITIDIISDLRAVAALTECQVFHPNGELERYITPMPNDMSRLMALRAQLDYILANSADPRVDLLYERRVVESLNER